MHAHDPREHIRGIHQILISDKKRIGFLFGAGSSFGTGLPSVRVPAIAEMTRKVIASVEGHSPAFEAAAKEIQQELGSGINIESLLSTIEAKRVVIGAGKLNGLDGKQFESLAAFVKDQIVKLVSIHDGLKPEERENFAHAKLSNWIVKARRRFPAEIFTTNYDYLFELALEGSGILTCLPIFEPFDA